MRTRITIETLLLLLIVMVASSVAQGQTAIVGATLIDGNGGAPVVGGVIVIEGDRIVAMGPDADVAVPEGAEVIDAAGQFVTPGFIDTNVHLSLYGGHTPERYESLVRYHDRQDEIVLEAAQLHLKVGVTTVRDSYGVLPPLVEVRDRIERGEAEGSRVLAAGNIVGWGGPFSMTFSLFPESGLTLFQEQMNELVSQGAGEDLMDMTPEELRVAINAYLDKGVDFVKYGGTGHTSMPTLIGFSPAAQKVLVEETHKRGLVAETHSTSLEGLRLSLEAGIDLVQHPEIVEPRRITDELVGLFRERDVICSMLVNTMTGEVWREHLETREAAQKALDEGPGPQTGHQGKAASRERTAAEVRRMERSLGDGLEIRRENAMKLIAGGCRTTVGTDNYRSAAPEFARGPKPETQDPGRGTILAIEGLVELGMTPSEAIVAATRNGAVASGRLDELGTLEKGKIADLLILEADPLEDIANIEKLALVMKGGKVIDVNRLPTAPVYYRAQTSR